MLSFVAGGIPFLGGQVVFHERTTVYDASSSTSAKGEFDAFGKDVLRCWSHELAHTTFYLCRNQIIAPMADVQLRYETYLTFRSFRKRILSQACLGINAKGVKTMTPTGNRRCMVGGIRHPTHCPITAFVSAEIRNGISTDNTAAIPVIRHFADSNSRIRFS